MAEPIANLAGEVEDFSVKANSIFPSDDQRIQLRLENLHRARSALMALDMRLSKCYGQMIKAPLQGQIKSTSAKRQKASAD